jgi:hypothetical protein
MGGISASEPQQLLDSGSLTVRTLVTSTKSIITLLHLSGGACSLTSQSALSCACITRTSLIPAIWTVITLKFHPLTSHYGGASIWQASRCRGRRRHVSFEEVDAEKREQSPPWSECKSIVLSHFAPYVVSR